MFPSRFLKAVDFADGDQTLTIADIREERIGQGRDADDKYVVYFEELEKGLVLNKTNSGIISKLHGDDTDDWIGKEVTLYSAEVQFKDDMVDAIRVRSKPPRKAGKAPQPEPQKAAAAPPRDSARAPARTPARPAPDGAGDAFDDDIDPRDIF
jgi:hypothetical protein